MPVILSEHCTVANSADVCIGWATLGVLIDHTIHGMGMKKGLYKVGWHMVPREGFDLAVPILLTYVENIHHDDACHALALPGAIYWARLKFFD
jgi:hypothetical protein